ncbi:hypothetical protein AAER49_04265, partial [Acinetobacter baumannii]|uniref:hypothetical protein n=1 Tax=Acinetobacter baumannii TaxID=470 RepID=UPI0031F39320
SGFANALYAGAGGALYGSERILNGDKKNRLVSYQAKSDGGSLPASAQLKSNSRLSGVSMSGASFGTITALP